MFLSSTTANFVVQFCPRRSRSKTRRVEVRRIWKCWRKKKPRGRIFKSQQAKERCTEFVSFFSCVSRYPRGFWVFLVHGHFGSKDLPCSKDCICVHFVIESRDFHRSSRRSANRPSFYVFFVLPGSGRIRNKTKQQKHKIEGSWSAEAQENGKE